MRQMLQKKRKGGRPKTGAGDQQMTFRLPTRLYNKLVRKAKADGLSKGQLVRDALIAAFS